MYAITRRLDALAPMDIDCSYIGGRDVREREKGALYENYTCYR